MPTAIESNPELILATQLALTKAECDRYKQLYEQTLTQLNQEQAAHAKTKDNLLKILGDAIASSRS
jgi:hypothetical protein